MSAHIRNAENPHLPTDRMMALFPLLVGHGHGNVKARSFAFLTFRFYINPFRRDDDPLVARKQFENWFYLGR